MKQMTYENAIELEGLSKSFDDFQLKDISFALPRGTIMGLIGENGAGKPLPLNSFYRCFDRTAEPFDCSTDR